MTNVVTVTFTGSDGTTLSTYDANWTKVTGVTGDLILATNRLRPSSTTTAAYYHSASPSSADYTVSADLVYQSIVANSVVGVLGRCSTSANTFYSARHNAGTGFQLVKVVAGATTQLGGSINSPVPASGETHSVKLDMSGTTIKVFVDGSGTATLTQTDSAISAAGKGGVRFVTAAAPSNSTATHLDNFSVDEVGGANGTATPSGVSSTGSFGSPTAAGDATTAPAGVSATGSVGTATATGAGSGTASPSGAGATGSVGTPAATGDANATPSGVSTTGQVGTATATGPQDGTAMPAGVGATGYVGNVTADGGGQAVTGGVGRWYDRTQTKDEIRKQREELGIIPKAVRKAIKKIVKKEEEKQVAEIDFTAAERQLKAEIARQDLEFQAFYARLLEDQLRAIQLERALHFQRMQDDEESAAHLLLM